MFSSVKVFENKRKRIVSSVEDNLQIDESGSVTISSLIASVVTTSVFNEIVGLVIKYKEKKRIRTLKQKT